MFNLRTKLALFNLLSKLVFTALFIGFLPLIVQKINLLQTDKELVNKREEVIALISRIGIEPFVTSDTENAFGSYNILKEEFVSLERVDLMEDWNFIEISQRLIEGETSDYRVLSYSFRVDGKTYLLQIGKSLTSIGHTEKNIKMVILIFLLLLFLVTLVSDLIYTDRTLRPLKHITGKLRSTSTPALFDKTPVKTSTSDFLQLDQTIRELMNKIDELFRKEKEITANVSHELMTPISVLRSKLENLLMQKDLNEDTATRIEESLRTLHRLKMLVNSLLMIARIESRQYLKEDSFSLSELLHEVAEEIRPVAEDADISLSEEYVTDLFLVNANRPLIFSMFYNVVNNAVKNTGAKGEVVISASVKNEVYEVTISDTGKGMTAEQIDNLFSRFKRKLDPKEDSTGIGLAITKSIADFHNITVCANSSPGEGTRFSFFISKNS